MTTVFNLDRFMPKPLLFDPTGDNQELLKELSRRWAGETMVKARRQESEGPIPVIDLLSAEEREEVQARPTATSVMMKKFQATLRGMKSPKYKEAVLSWMFESYSKHGVEQKTPALWSQLASRSQFEVQMPNGRYVLTLESATNTLLVNLPDGRTKELAYSTFEDYATGLKKRIRAEEQKS